jgi:cell division protein FtsQ
VIRVLSIIIATLLTCYVVASAFFFRDVKEEGACQGLEIVVRDSLDKHFVTDGDLVYLLKKSKLYPVKKPMNIINTEKIEEELLSNDMISHVEVYKTPSRRIKLEIEQKMPILRVNSPSGNYYIDNVGSIMPLSRHYVAHVLVASGYVEKEFAKNELYKFALYLQDNEFWNDQIDQIYVDADKNVELIPRVGNHRIILGTFEDYPGKLEKLRLFYEQAIPKVGWDKYSAINLKYKNQIVCTKR